MHLLDGGDIELLALHLEVDRLSAGHTESAAGLAQHVDQSQANGRGLRQRRIAGEQLKGQGL